MARNAVCRSLASASHFFRLSSSIRPLTVETLVDSCLRSHLSQPWVCEDLTLAQLSALRRLCFSHLRSGLHLLVLAPLAKLATPAHTTINQGTKPSSKRRGLQTSREEGNLEIGHVVQKFRPSSFSSERHFSRFRNPFPVPKLLLLSRPLYVWDRLVHFG